MAEITIKLEGPDLASRKTAAIERHKLLGHAAAGNKVAVDLSNVVSLSYSYADELIGVLAAVKGWEWLIKNVQLKNANEHVLRVVAEAVNRRLKETGQPVKRSA
ncbi:MAG: STAS-like domain-containing protein [Burkholderiales bacterium]|nr:STAS-like domain-containing protein [Burkholderiales bacterium]